jgi:hypothetical protein
MTEERELRIPYTDLLRPSIRCKKCRTEITVDFTKSREVRVYAKGNQFECPMCRTEFDSRLKESLVIFQEWLQYVEESGHDVSFRVKL